MQPGLIVVTSKLELRDVEPSLKELQAGVGGYIDLFWTIGTRAGSVDFFCHDEGALINLQPIVKVVMGTPDERVVWHIHGPVVVSASNAVGKSRRLTADEVACIKLVTTATDQWLTWVRKS